MKFTADSSLSVSAIDCRTVGYVSELLSQIKENAMCFSNLKTASHTDGLNIFFIFNERSGSPKTILIIESHISSNTLTIKAIGVIQINKIIGACPSTFI